MTIRNFDKLLAPRSVALIGASPRSGSVGAVLTRNLVAGRVPVELVNPHHAEIGGRRCFPDVASLPEPPDLAVIATPPMTVPGLVAELGAKGSARGRRHQRRVRRAATRVGASRRRCWTPRARTSCASSGPIASGSCCRVWALNASFAHLTPAAGRSPSCHSPARSLTSVIDWAVARQIGFSHLVSLGDMADVDFGDMLDYLAADTR